MTHTEVFDCVLNNHHLNYKTLAEKNGKPYNYYLIRLNKMGNGIAAKAYSEYLGLMGAEIYAVSGKDVKLLSMMMTDEKTGSHTPLDVYIRLCGLFGYSMVVRDGDKEYAVTSGEVNEKTKVRRRKAGAAARIHADLHGAGAV